VKEHYDWMRISQRRHLVFYSTTTVIIFLVMVSYGYFFWKATAGNSLVFLVLVLILPLVRQLFKAPPRTYGNSLESWIWSVDVWQKDKLIIHALDISLIDDKAKLHYAWITRGHKLRIFQDEGDWFLGWQQFGLERHIPLERKGDRLIAKQQDYVLYEIRTVIIT
jgi:hypothetical protein